jgi:hypothetical protein
MFRTLEYLFRRVTRPSSPQTPRNGHNPSRREGGVRLHLESLEGRIALSAATHFLVLVPRVAYVGVPAEIDVIALDASNHRVTDYTGTIRLSSTDPATTFAGTALPTTYTFTTADRGAHEFSLTPGAVGTETLAATDTTTSSTTGSAELLVNAAPVVTHFLVVVPRSVGAGVAAPVVVEALDASNHVVPNYTGTVQLTSTGTGATLAGATLPATFTFTAGDHGEHVFHVTFSTDGSQTVTAADTASSTITGSATTTVGATTTTPAPCSGGDGAALVGTLTDHVFQDFRGRF